MAFRGRGRGRGGLRIGGTTHTAAPEVTFNTPGKLYPDYVIPSAPLPSQEEKLQVKYHKELQASILHETPFHIQVRERASGISGDGVERYSDRWRPKQKAAQSLTDLHTDERFFPEELLSVLHGEGGGRKKKKQQKFDLSKFLDMNVEPDVNGLETSSQAGDEAEKASDEEEEEVESEDEAFSDDGNDYEDNYFSGGENDFEDVGGDEEAF